MKRITVSVGSAEYLILEHEARRRGVSVGDLLRDAVSGYTSALSASHKPRMGVVSVAPGVSQESAEDELSPILDRARRRGWIP